MTNSRVDDARGAVRDGMMEDLHFLNKIEGQQCMDGSVTLGEKGRSWRTKYLLGMKLYSATQTH